jgi:hypothetical protein
MFSKTCSSWPTLLKTQMQWSIQTSTRLNTRGFVPWVCTADVERSQHPGYTPQQGHGCNSLARFYPQCDEHKQDTLPTERQRGHRFVRHKASTQNHPTSAGEVTDPVQHHHHRSRCSRNSKRPRSSARDARTDRTLKRAGSYQQPTRRSGTWRSPTTLN